jgi:hypothetical protein
MKSLPENLYGNLTTEERIALTLAAIANNNDEGLGRLQRTCPRLTYEMYDLNYAGKMSKLHSITQSYIILCQSFYTEIIEMEAYIFLLPCLAEPNKPTSNLQELTQAFEQKKDKAISRFKAIHQALLNFCEKRKLESQAIIECSQINVYCAKRTDYLQSKVSINQETLDLTLKGFLQTWEK